MKKINKKALYAALVIVLVIIIGALWHYRAKAPKPEMPLEEASTSAGQKASSSKTEDATGAFWEGTLKASDNPKKGSLMLLTDKSAIYINTSRDFSDLIGKQVKVSYDGTLENFVLGDITEK